MTSGLGPKAELSRPVEPPLPGRPFVLLRLYRSGKPEVTASGRLRRQLLMAATDGQRLGERAGQRAIVLSPT